MSPELNFGPYVDFEDGKKVVKDLTFGNPTPEGVVLADDVWPCLLCD
jgi:hypothetical protein